MVSRKCDELCPHRGHRAEHGAWEHRRLRQRSATTVRARADPPTGSRDRGSPGRAHRDSSDQSYCRHFSDCGTPNAHAMKVIKQKDTAAYFRRQCRSSHLGTGYLPLVLT